MSVVQGRSTAATDRGPGSPALFRTNDNGPQRRGNGRRLKTTRRHLPDATTLLGLRTEGTAGFGRAHGDGGVYRAGEGRAGHGRLEVRGTGPATDCLVRWPCRPIHLSLAPRSCELVPFPASGRSMDRPVVTRPAANGGHRHDAASLASCRRCRRGAMRARAGCTFPPRRSRSFVSYGPRTTTHAVSAREAHPGRAPAWGQREDRPKMWVGERAAAGRNSDQLLLSAKAVAAGLGICQSLPERTRQSARLGPLRGAEGMETGVRPNAGG